MLLLDLPPEIFQRVIEIFVRKSGIREAMEARQVSTTFFSYINEEIIARQPVNKLGAEAPKRLIQENLAVFLERRTVARYGAPDLLPSAITKIVDHLIKAVETEAEESRGCWTKKVIAAVIKLSPDTLRLALFNSCAAREACKWDDTGSLALAVAIHLDDRNLVNRLLTLGANPWRSCALFGFGNDAIYLATRSKATQLVRTLLSSASRSITPIRCQSRVVCRCTVLALRDNNTDLAIELFSWHIQHLGKPHSNRFSRFVRQVVAIDAVAFLQSAQTSGCLDLNGDPHDGDVIMGLVENPKPQAMLRYLKSKGLICIDGCYRQSRRNRASQPDSLIDVAVRYDSIPLAEAILTMSDNLDTESGFRRAVSRNKLPMVRLFLDYGADPEAGSSSQGTKYDRSTCELAKPGSEVYEIVRKAVQQKVRRLGKEYTAPTFWVRDVEQRTYVPIQYTYHSSEL